MGFGGSSGSSRTVFVGNLPYDASEEQLVSIFSEVGPVASMRLVFDKETGKPKGYGFCEFHDRAAAESAVRNLNNSGVNGRSIRVDFAENDSRPLPGGSRAPGPPPPGMHGGPGPAGPHVSAEMLASGAVGQQNAIAAGVALGQMLPGPNGPGAVDPGVTNVLAGMTHMQLVEVMHQLKALAQANPGHVKGVLTKNPQLTKALFQAQLLLGMIKGPQQDTPAPAGQVGAPPPGPPPQGQRGFAGAQPPLPPQRGGPPVPPGPPMMAGGQQPMGQGQPMMGGQQMGGMGMMPPPPPQQAQQAGYAGGGMQDGPPPAPGMGAPQDAAQQQQLLQQVMSMTDEQIAMLPPEQRAQVLQLKGMVASQQGRR